MNARRVLPVLLAFCAIALPAVRDAGARTRGEGTTVLRFPSEIDENGLRQQLQFLTNPTTIIIEARREPYVFAAPVFVFDRDNVTI